MISPSSQESPLAHTLIPTIAAPNNPFLYDNTWDESLALYSTTTPPSSYQISDNSDSPAGHGCAPWDLFGHDMYPYAGDFGGAVPLGKPRPVHQQPSFGDVQLFGDDEPPLFAAPLASSSSTSPNFGAPNDLPLPDLIPDSPTDFSPPNTYSLPFQHSSAYQQQRNERSSSVPVPSLPKPIRRRTQEFKDQQSFVPTLYGQPSNGLQNPFAPPAPAPAFAVGNSFAGGSPSTDHPLSLPEQQDLLDRVRRDLHGVDLDNIKGPLRALALSSSNPPHRQPSSSSFGRSNIDLPPSPQHFPLGALHQLSQQQQRDKDEMMRKTVSPQEAFLDYEDVDHRLHPSGSTAGSPFGVGASLFAPIPRAASQPTTTRTPPPPLSTSHSASPTRASSPAGAGLSTSPHNASLLGSARKPHPFAVPQNAVSWKDRRQASGDDANGEDDEGSEEGDDDEDSPVVKQEDGVVAMSALRSLQPESSSEDEVDDDGVIGQFDEDTKPTLPSSTTRPAHLPPPTSSSSSSTSTTSLFIPPAPAPNRTSPSATAHDHMRPSARRALDLLQHVDDPLPELNADGDADAEGEEDAEGEADDEVAPLPARSRAASSRAQTAEEEQDDDDYIPTASTSSVTASGRPARSTAGQRKRTRSPFADAPSDSEGSEMGDGESFHASGSDSDAPTRASSATGTTHHRRSAPAPNKRRRRVPPSSSLHSTSSTAIRCPHVNTDDGTTCGVVFRRPYDLARHRETIHGETAEGKVAKKVEWSCKGCGGTFSRKDALIRHARIRGHKSGI